MAEQKSESKKAKVQRAKFNATYFEQGVPKYKADEHYPVTDEVKTRVAAGDAEIVTLEMESDQHEAEHAAATAALNAARKRTHEAEAVARKRGELK